MSAHGTSGRYAIGCRCDACKAGNAARKARWRAGWRKPPAEHGTRPKYTSGCRCDLCRSASRASRAAYRQAQRNAGLLPPKRPKSGKPNWRSRSKPTPELQRITAAYQAAVKRRRSGVAS